MAHLGVADLTDIAHAAYGRELRDVARLHGGSKKGVYRLTLDDGTTGTAYVWRRSENYWPEHEEDSLFGNANGRDLFLTAHTALAEAGACVPRLVLVDSDVIVIEDLRGRSLTRLSEPRPDSRLAPSSRCHEIMVIFAATRGSANGSHRNGHRKQEGRSRMRTLGPQRRSPRRRRPRPPANPAAVTPIATRARSGLPHSERSPDMCSVPAAGSALDIEGATFLDVAPGARVPRA